MRCISWSPLLPPPFFPSLFTAIAETSGNRGEGVLHSQEFLRGKGFGDDEDEMGIGECTFFRTGGGGGGGGGPVPFLSPFLGHTPKPGNREAKEEGVLLPSEEGKEEEKREKVLHMFAQKNRGTGGGTGGSRRGRKTGMPKCGIYGREGGGMGTIRGKGRFLGVAHYFSFSLSKRAQFHPP